jgi:hypothetical protein
MDDDRKSIGLTAETQQMLSELEANCWFGDKADAARFCMAFAIREKVAD